MDIALWMLAGSALGWAGYKFFEFNEGRGMIVSMIIGAAGGLLGGKFIAPMFTAAAVPGGFSTSALMFAAAVAAGFLAVGNLVERHWGI